MVEEGNEKLDFEAGSNVCHERFPENNVERMVLEVEAENNADVVGSSVLVGREETDLVCEVDYDTEWGSGSMNLSSRLSHENVVVNAKQRRLGLAVSQPKCCDSADIDVEERRTEKEGVKVSRLYRKHGKS